MNKSLVFFALFLTISTHVLARLPEAIFKDGTIEFEPFKMQVGTTTGIELPDEFQINISTCVLQKGELKEESVETAGWANIDEFRAVTTDKRALLRRIRQLRRFIANMEDEDGNPAPLAQRAPYLRRLNWLVQRYKR